MLYATTPRHASVATNGLWRVAARAWHEPPADTCSVVSARPLHARSIKIHNSNIPCFTCDSLWDIAVPFQVSLRVRLVISVVKVIM